MTYVYRLSNLGASSKKYGNCEICGEYASEMFLQVELDESIRGGRGRSRRTGDAFGHEDCLIAKRKDEDDELLRR